MYVVIGLYICHWIIVKYHMFVSNVIIVKNRWAGDTVPLTQYVMAEDSCSQT